MMYCKKCGMKLKESTNICPRCKANQIQLMEAEKLAKEIEEVDRKKRRKRTAIISAICAVIVAAAVVVLIIYLNRPQTINLNEYLTVTFSGADGEGEATYSFDTETFSTDYYGELTFRDESTYNELMESLGESADMNSYAIEYLFDNCVSGTLNNADGLSNGDYVSFVWDVDEETIEEIFGVNVEYTDEIFTVSDLEEDESESESESESETESETESES